MAHSLPYLIARRAAKQLDAIPPAYIQRAISTCNSAVCPLDLSALLVAKDDDFFHDVCGIITHMDWANNRLRDCFLPRFAAPKPTNHPPICAPTHPLPTGADLSSLRAQITVKLGRAFTQEHLARELGITRQTVNRMEASQKPIPWTTYLAARYILTSIPS